MRELASFLTQLSTHYSPLSVSTQSFPLDTIPNGHPGGVAEYSQFHAFPCPCPSWLPTLTAGNEQSVQGCRRTLLLSDHPKEHSGQGHPGQIHRRHEGADSREWVQIVVREMRRYIFGKEEPSTQISPLLPSTEKKS